MLIRAIETVKRYRPLLHLRMFDFKEICRDFQRYHCLSTCDCVRETHGSFGAVLAFGIDFCLCTTLARG